jgi:hypothetical protein
MRLPTLYDATIRSHTAEEPFQWGEKATVGTKF